MEVLMFRTGYFITLPNSMQLFSQKGSIVQVPSGRYPAILSTDGNAFQPRINTPWLNLIGKNGGAGVGAALAFFDSVEGVIIEPPEQPALLRRPSSVPGDDGDDLIDHEE
jgi:hypothetical protein